MNGPEEKEEKHDAGSDVKLTCDVVGYPIKFEWKDEDKKSLGKARLLFRCFRPYCSAFLVTLIASRRVQQVTFEVASRLELNKSIHINI